VLLGTTITVAVALGLPLDFYALLHFDSEDRKQRTEWKER